MEGSTDKPIGSIDADEFGIRQYVEGLGDFIRECDTPMTVAIQGDWGCGKTSMMQMVRDYLKKTGEIIDVWFNTWQFSQFSMDDKLAITFLSHMVNDLGKVAGKDTKAATFVQKLKGSIKGIVVGAVKQFVGDGVSEVAEAVMAKKEADLPTEVEDLKESFKGLIETVTSDNNGRVVVFIDDLDRLQPVRAVELLEILKLFIDCNNCVFVMAIDTSVVFQGIREKYGQDISTEKAQSFFDKIIQLPFRMPVQYYDLQPMIDRLLGFLTENSSSDDIIVDLVRRVSGGNPRTIKRLVNIFLLTDKVAASKKAYSPENETLARRVTFALTCIQLRYEKTYNFILKQLSISGNSFMQNWTSDKFQTQNENLSPDSEKFEKQLVNIGCPLYGEDNEEKADYFFTLHYLMRQTAEFCAKFGSSDPSERFESIKRAVMLYSLSGISRASISDDEAGKNGVCRSCGAKLQEGAAFCAECGEPIK